MKNTGNPVPADKLSPDYYFPGSGVLLQRNLNINTDPSLLITLIFPFLDNSLISILNKKGLTNNSVGRMGHGLGLQLTEPPSIMQNDKTIIKDGDLVKVDFGVHIDGYLVDNALSFSFNHDLDLLVGAQPDVVLRTLHSDFRLTPGEGSISHWFADKRQYVVEGWQTPLEVHHGAHLSTIDNI